jgi:hypothetical protein
MDVPNTQYFYNRVGSEYPYAINGAHDHTDVYDMFYNPVRGFSSRYMHQKVTLPTFREPIIERVNFAIYMKVSVNNINVREAGNLNHGLFHRFKYNGNNIVTKIALTLRKNNWSSDILPINTINGWATNLPNIACTFASRLISSVMRDFERLLFSHPAHRNQQCRLFLCIQWLRDHDQHTRLALSDFGVG